MKSEKKTVKFGEVAEFRNGVNFSKDSHGKGCKLIGVPAFRSYLKPNYNVLGEINPDSVASEEDYVKPGDLLFVRSNGNKALVGRSLLIESNEKALFSGFCIRARFKSDKITPKFCAYFTKTKTFKDSLAGPAGTNINNLNQGILSDVSIPLFCDLDQANIVRILSDIDEKIDLNNQINAELEKLAKLIYDYWFVQFDFPISAELAAKLGNKKLEGKPYRQSGGPMVYNEVLKREIPQGWGPRSVGSLLQNEPRTKKILSSEYSSTGAFPIIDQSKDFVCGYTDDEDAVISDQPKIVFGDHTRILKYINFPFARGADGTQVLTSNEEKIPQELFFQILSSFDLSNYGYARHFKFLKEQIVTMPNCYQGVLFRKRVAPFYTMINHIREENSELENLRDWLLPMLMNGQVTVTD